VRRALRAGDATYEIVGIDGAPGVERLPYTLRILLENVLRHGSTDEADAILRRDGTHELGFRPGRALLHDTTGVPALVDLASLRDAVAGRGGDAGDVVPVIPSVLVVDHSLQVEAFGRADAMERNIAIEYERNAERYAFLRWAQATLDGFEVVPPNSGIMHQVNLEALASVVAVRDGVAFPDTIVGSDSHTTMINGLGVLGWGVGGIEALAAMLGEPLPLLVPQVVGFRIGGRLPEGATATDLVLRVTQLLREVGVVGKFVEYFGPGVSSLALADRATIANMCPEYGATCGFFPVDEATLEYLRLTGRDEQAIALVEAYCKENLLWHDPAATADYDGIVELDLATIEPSLAGPRRPHDRVALADAKASFAREFGLEEGDADELRDGSVVIAAITSCTNTSNPSVMMTAGLVARNAVERGLASKPWVKTSLAPGSRVVVDYYRRSGLDVYLDRLGFNLVGFGCTTCIGASGPLPPEVAAEVADRDLLVCAVLSGNRNFEARIHPDVKASYLMSPPLVVAYALAGRMDIDVVTEPLGRDADGGDVFLRDLWPSAAEVDRAVAATLDGAMFRRAYADLFVGDSRWQAIETPASETFPWDPSSTYLRRAPHLDLAPTTDAIVGARCLVALGDSATTDHLSPAGAIRADSTAGRYLNGLGVEQRDFNTYATRRGNHEVMVRGAFGNVRLRNALVPGSEGPVTVHLPSDEEMSIFDAGERYRAEGVPTIVLAGRDYGTGSSRDWGAKGPRLLGVRAVLAQSFERIHRSNLLMMGILPLELPSGLVLTGREEFTIDGIDGGGAHEVTVTADDVSFTARVRLDTPREREYFRAGGILPYVLGRLVG
jgi:aconitate hydratase